MTNTKLVRIWKSESSLEIFSLEQQTDPMIARGIIETIDDSNFQVRYQIEMDSSWKLKKVIIASLKEPGEPLSLSITPNGIWVDDKGRHLTQLDDCTDVDISATPFTNSLPVGRLGASLKKRQKLNIAYIKLPEFTISPVIQYYSKISEHLYLYENMTSGFKAELQFDEHGLVKNYPGRYETLYDKSR